VAQRFPISFRDTEPEDLTLDCQSEVSAFTGAVTVRFPLAVTTGRSDLTPGMALEYSSSGGNSPFGLGWQLTGLPSISVNTRLGHPRYDIADGYVSSTQGELVPALRQAGSAWEPRVEDLGTFFVHCYRARVEHGAVRFERWVHKGTGRVHWRSRDRQSVLTIFGLGDDGRSRIADPADPDRVFTWLAEAIYDPRGNSIQIEYQPENRDRIDPTVAFERTRLDGVLAQRYPKHVRYGNTHPLQADAPVPIANRWSFDVVCDYGDHDPVGVPAPTPDRPWGLRSDPHSTFGPGFEVRTYRLCRRVLLFHHFDELGPDPVLVRTYRFEHDLDEAGSTLQAVHLAGSRRDPVSGSSVQRSLPPVRFTYSAPSVARAFEPAPAEATVNVPHGLAGPNYYWTDLFGEGVPGILSDAGPAWYFKANDGGGRFAAQQLVVSRPAWRLSQCALADVDSDGNTNLVVMQGRQAGYFEFDRDAEAWTVFRAFPSLPHVESAGQRVQWLDLSGDGRADLVVAAPDRLIWYPSLGKEGFGSAVEIQRPQGDIPNAPIAEDTTQDFFFADMNGDGLLDQVRVRNGRVEYWPSLGYGRFGDPILMEDSPVFSPDAQFDPRRVVLVDLDGNGSADIVYVGDGEVRYWINAEGNRLLPGGRIGNLPQIDCLSTLRVADFLADGTPCLLWSSPLAGAYSPIQYLPLTSGVKPRLLVTMNDSRGLEERISYSTSAAHYLRDKRAGRPWRTKLNRHPVVVDRKDLLDSIGGLRATSRYEYHDGFFDGPEQAFRGFGVVDIYDAEGLDSSPEAPELLTNGTCLRTWFHQGRPLVGALPDRYEGDAAAPLIPPVSFEDPTALAPGEYEDGLRALAGAALRQEVYALGPSGQRAGHPLQVQQNAYRVRRQQPSRLLGGLPSVFRFYAAESFHSHYEQQPDDPRSTHRFTFEIDDFGNPLQECQVAYARRASIPSASPAQAQTLIAAFKHRFLALDTSERYETAIPIEEQELEVAGPPVPSSGVYGHEPLRASLAAALAAPLAFHQHFTGGVETRLASWYRHFYWNDAQNAALPLGSVGSRTLAHHSDQACFTPETVTQVFGLLADASLLQTDGGYRLTDGHWWRSTETRHCQPAAGFFRLERVERPDGGVTTYVYDPGNLALIELRDPLGNHTRAEIDYHLVAPFRITDANNHVTEVLYDPLGIAVVSTSQGQVLDGGGTPRLYGFDRLATYTPRAGATFAAVRADPAYYVQNAAQFLYYELDTWTALALPPRSIRLLREDLVLDGSGGAPAPGTIRTTVAHFDGLRQPLQTKLLVEAGPAIQRNSSGDLVLDGDGLPVEGPATERWQVTGFTLHNRKLQPVREYEPFFSTTSAYEPEEALAHFGVFRQRQYDALGRLRREDSPNETFARVEYRSWETRHYDPNDTVLDSQYRTLREGLANTNVEKKALLKAEAHADTPTITHLNPLGAEIKRVQTGSGGFDRTTETKRDIRSRIVEAIDSRGLTAIRYRRDMQGRTLLLDSMDAGQTRTLPDVHDRPAHTWDSRGGHQRRRFDALDRPLSVVVDGLLGLNHMTERFVYGEDASVTQAELRQARGRLAVHRDQAGVLTLRQYDPKGLILRSERQLREDYKTESDWTNPAGVVLEAPVHRIQTAFDALGRVRQQSLPDGTTRHLAYLRGGGLNRVELDSNDGLLDGLVVLSASDFNARAQRTRVLLGNGVEVVHRYDDETFRVNRITARRLPTGGDAGATLQDLEYTYDPVGNVTHCVDNVQLPSTPGQFLTGLNVSPASEFTYDAFDQLIAATGRVHQALLEHDYRPDVPVPEVRNGTRHLNLNNGAAVERYTRTYEYDAAGNVHFIRHQGTSRSWSTEVWTSPASNRSLPAFDPDGNPTTNRELRFDANGNCTFLPHMGELAWSYRNAPARAVIVDRSGSGQPDDAEYYVYDGGGLRIRKVTEKIVSGQLEITEHIDFDGCEIKRRRRGTTTLLERLTTHVSDGTNRAALVHRWTTDTLARETADVTQPRIRYQLTDHLGSSAMEVDEAGSVISYEEYFPYGGSAFIAGDNLREVDMKAYRFCGKERDEATGLYYFGHRYYAPWIGKWLSPDPIGPEDSLNLYEYVRNNPVNLTDPDGLNPDEPTVEWRSAPAIPPEILRRLSPAQLEQLNTPGYGWWVEGDRVRVVTREELLRLAREWSRRHGRTAALIAVGPDTEGNGAGMGAGGDAPGDAVGPTDPPATPSPPSTVPGPPIASEEEANMCVPPPPEELVCREPAAGAETGDDGTGGPAGGPTGGDADGGGSSDSADPDATTVDNGDGRWRGGPYGSGYEDGVAAWPGDPGATGGGGEPGAAPPPNNDIDWGTVAVNAVTTVAIGAAVIVAGAALVAAGIVSAPFVLTVGLLAMVGVGLMSFFRRSDEAFAAGNPDPAGRAALAALGDTVGVTSIVEGASGRDAVTDRVLRTQERSERLGTGIGAVATLAGSRGLSRLGTAAGTRGLAASGYNLYSVPSIARPTYSNPLVTGTYTSPQGVVWRANVLTGAHAGFRTWRAGTGFSSGFYGRGGAVLAGTPLRHGAGNFWHVRSHFADLPTRPGIHSYFLPEYRPHMVLLGDAPYIAGHGTSVTVGPLEVLPGNVVDLRTLGPQPGLRGGAWVGAEYPNPTQVGVVGGTPNPNQPVLGTPLFHYRFVVEPGATPGTVGVVTSFPE